VLVVIHKKVKKFLLNAEMYFMDVPKKERRRVMNCTVVNKYVVASFSADL